MIMEGGDAELVTAWSSKVPMWHNTKAHMTDTKSFSGKLLWAVKRGKDCRRCTSRGSRGQSRVGEWTNAMNFQAVVWCLIMFSTPIYSNLVILGVISFEPHPFVKASCSCSSTRLCIQSDSWQVTEEQCEQPASRDVKFCCEGTSHHRYHPCPFCPSLILCIVAFAFQLQRKHVSSSMFQ